MARLKKDEAEIPRTKLRIKGQRKEWSHLFKSDVRPLKKNVSFKKGLPKIEHLDHTHVFHTLSSQMKPMQYWHTVAGHFHEVTWRMTPEGPVVTEVGPPMTYKYTRGPAGTRRDKCQVEWYDDAKGKTIVDNHTHEFHYVHSEELLERNIRAVAGDHSADEARELGLEGVDA